MKTSPQYDTLPLCTNTLDVFKCSGCLTLIIYSVEWKLFPYMIRKKYAGWLYPSMIHLIGEVLPRYYGTGTVHINVSSVRFDASLLIIIVNYKVDFVVTLQALLFFSQTRASLAVCMEWLLTGAPQRSCTWWLGCLSHPWISQSA